MRDPRISFRSAELAAVLAFLMPGAGHYYQGRRLKAGLFASCILATWFTGMILGDWQPVYSQIVSPSRHGSIQMYPAETAPNSGMSIGYAAQVLVGLPALPALVQQARYSKDEGMVASIPEPLVSDFVGVVHFSSDDGPTADSVTGQIRLNPSEDWIQTGGVTGRLEVIDRDQNAVAFDFSGSVRLGKAVFGSPRREIECELQAPVIGTRTPRTIQGTIQRSFIDWFQAPRDNAELDRLHGKLSQHFDLASVFTWIAGLLNLMVIWDAYEGPAYGYGDEKPEEDEDGEASDGVPES